MTAADASRMVADLQRLVRQPSVSATGEGIAECSRLVADMLEESGIPSTVLKLPGRAPLVYGHLESGAERTVLFYNHYDVQPAEPLDEWKHLPFGGELEDGRVYGRGATDDKGELVSRIEAVRMLLRDGGPACDVKFVIEGEEEVGSGGIPEYLDRYGDMMACDGIVWEFGYVGPAGLPVIGLGMKGMLFVELTARGPRRDLHSGMAPLVQNPAWRLVGALSALAGDDGRILVPDWYAGAQPLTDAERDAVRGMRYDEGAAKEDMGVSDFVLGQDAEGAKMDLATVATCNIAGLRSGYLGRGAKTVLPARASAKLDLRLVAGMDPEVQWRRLVKYLKDRGYGDVQTTLLHAEPGIRASPDGPFVGAVRRAADAAYGGHALAVTYPETGPVWQFSTRLNAPCVLAGGTPAESPIHAPDEYAAIRYMEKTAEMMAELLLRPGV